MTANRIAIYGKGGIGKSTIATNLSILFAQQGQKVLHVGCDPKRDSSLKLMDGKAAASVLEALAAEGAKVAAEHIVAVGRHGVEVIESGGPEPGVGCAGRGVSLMIERIDELEVIESRGYDVVVYDVLGDVVCGGFAAPLRQGAGRQVYIVTSEEPMSLFAANNIAKAVIRFQRNGVSLGGLIANIRDPGDYRTPMAAFAERLGTTILAYIERDPLVRKAEYRFRTVVEDYPSSPIAGALRDLSAEIERRWTAKPASPPTPLQDSEFVTFIREHFAEPSPDEPGEALDKDASRVL